MSHLAAIAPGHSLAAEHAATWRDMTAEGMPNRPQDINSSSRTRAEQVKLYARYLADKATGRKPPRMAAKPGASKHEFPPGCAIDVQTGSPTWEWLVKNGARFGIHRPIASEPWHFEFGQRPAQPQTQPINSLTQEGSMRAVATTSGRRFVLGELTYQDMSKHWDQASHEAKIWNSDTGSEPQIIPDATLDLAIGQIQQRRAQLAAALKALGV